MSIFKRGLGDTVTQLVPSRASTRVGSVLVSSDSALKQSVVWAALVLRANMVSTLPLDVFRKIGNTQVEVERPPVLLSPQGGITTLGEFLWASQFDLDRVGNSYGIITAKDGFGIPREIQLVDHNTVTVRVDKKTFVVTYEIGRKSYAAADVWHEKQFQIPGLVMGLSPVAYAAWSIGLYQSAQEFGLEWFANGGQIPSGHLQNTMTKLTGEQASEAASRYKAGVANRDIFVSGNDWEFKTVNSESKDAEFLQTQKDAEQSIARFFGVPGDLVDVQGNASNVTYANITQRNLQFLIYHLQPTLKRREDALSRLVQAPRFVKFNTGALLRMDPETQSRVLAAEVLGGLTAQDEARALMNRAPFTDQQWADFERIKARVTQPLNPQNGEAL